MKKGNISVGLIIFSIIVLAIIGTIFHDEIKGFLNDLDIGTIDGNDGCSMDLLPDRVTVMESRLKFNINKEPYASGYPYGSVPKIVSNWADGTTMGVREGMSPLQEEVPFGCNYGATEGENINYIYCPDISYTKNYEIISDEGVIEEQGTTYFTMDLILEKEGEIITDERGYEIFNITGETWVTADKDWRDESYPLYMNYSIVSAECN